MFKEGVTHPQTPEKNPEFEEEYVKMWSLKRKLDETKQLTPQQQDDLDKNLDKLADKYAKAWQLDPQEQFEIDTCLAKLEKQYSNIWSLKRKYAKMGRLDLYEELEMDKCLEHFLVASLKEKGHDISFGVIDGSVPEKDRGDIVKALGKEHKGKNHFGVLATSKCGGESQNFSRANWVYKLDQDYCPKTEEQDVPRSFRKGQQKTVYVYHLRGKDSIEIPLRDYVDQKRIIISISKDGIDLTEEERDLLKDTKGKQFAELIQQMMLGGVSINVNDAVFSDYAEIEVKQRQQRKSSDKPREISPSDSEMTPAQRINFLIGKDKRGCWYDPELVELYDKHLEELSVLATHRAKIIYLVKRHVEGDIEFPSTVLSEGAGNSILYKAFHGLEGLLDKHNLKMPLIVDRDLSYPMLLKGTNPNKLLGCMTGKNSALADNLFDWIDHASMSLLRNPNEVKAALDEAGRLGGLGSLLTITTKNMRVTKKFSLGMKDRGYELLTGRTDGFSLSPAMLKHLKKQHGEHFANSYASKLKNTHLLLARQTGDPSFVKASSFWFESGTEDVTPIETPEPQEKVDKPVEANTELEVPKEKGKQKKRSWNGTSPNYGQAPGKKDDSLYVNSRRALPGEISGLDRDLLTRTVIEL